MVNLARAENCDAHALQGMTPTKQGRYHVFVFKHSHEGDALQSLGESTGEASIKWWPKSTLIVNVRMFFRTHSPGHTATFSHAPHMQALPFNYSPNHSHTLSLHLLVPRL
jgi:hypothetical protein